MSDRSVVPAHPLRPVIVYTALALVGLAGFLYPFWLPESTIVQLAATGAPHQLIAPFLVGVTGAVVVGALLLEIRSGGMNGATIAVLGVLSAMAALLRLLDLPVGGSGLFFLVVLAGVALGPRFGLLHGVTTMAVSALLTGGVGPWLAHQMLALGAVGTGAGVVGRLTRRLRAGPELAIVALYGWLIGFAFGMVMNLWFWPFTVGTGELAWVPGSSILDTAGQYWRFYATTSLAWDAGRGVANVVLIGLTGTPALVALRRVGGRLRPAVVFDPEPPVGRTASGLTDVVSTCSTSGRTESMEPARGSRSEAGADPQP